MKNILKKLYGHDSLDRPAASDLMLRIGEGKYTDTEIASLVTVYLMRTVTIEELLGFRDALWQMSMPVDLEQKKLLDIVGTGGDGKNTFNISTLSCFIVAGTGQKVAKHGNYGSTSMSGSSNVMELLGYKFKAESESLTREVEEANICFLHAPLFHPALKNVGKVRKQLGARTFFNMLGPLVNPAKPSNQLIGVYNLEMARIYNYLLQDGNTNYAIVHGLDGYDEISLTGDTKIITNKGEKIWSAEGIGKRLVIAKDIEAGTTAEEAAKIFTNILEGKGTWAQNAVVLANAATALQVCDLKLSYEQCYQEAVKSLESGMALHCFKKLISLQ